MSRSLAENTAAEIRRLAQAILSTCRIVLTTHENPDGDGLGAELAMREGLMILGKSVAVLNDAPTPDEYRFLDKYRVLQRYSPQTHRGLLACADMVILLDAGAPERTGRVQAALEGFAGTTAVIDHHPGRGWGDMAVVDPSVCSTTYLVYSLLREFSTPVSKTLAEVLYIGILVDTMAFRNANTNWECLGLAASLVEAGADPAEMWQRVFGQRPVGRVKLEGEFFASLHTALSGRLVWGVVDAQMLKRRRQGESAIEGFVERALDVRGAEMAILFVEESPDTTRVSLRSREPVAVDGLARELGGGGHRLAAGAIVTGVVGDVETAVLRRAKALLPARTVQIERSSAGGSVVSE